MRKILTVAAGLVAALALAACGSSAPAHPAAWLAGKAFSQHQGWGPLLAVPAPAKGINYQIAVGGTHFDIIVVLWSLCVEDNSISSGRRCCDGWE